MSGSVAFGVVFLTAFVLGGASLLGLRWLTSRGSFERADPGADPEADRDSRRMYEVGAFRERDVVGIRWLLFSGEERRLRMGASDGRAIARLLLECCDRADRWRAQQRAGRQGNAPVKRASR